MAKKPAETNKPKRVYRKKTDAKTPLKREPKTPYNWRKHLKQQPELDVQPQPQYDGPENHPEYLRAEAAVEKDLLFAELDRWIAMFPNALNSLLTETGEIKPEDVMYHLNLISRILKNKYEEKQVIM
jgi:hypothetical protein